jgi:hypothetical protein
MSNSSRDTEGYVDIDPDQLHDFVVVHGFGRPTAAGYTLGKHLMDEGDDYATAAAEIVARGMTDDAEQD